MTSYIFTGPRLLADNTTYISPFCEYNTTNLIPKTLLNIRLFNGDINAVKEFDSAKSVVIDLSLCNLIPLAHWQILSPEVRYQLRSLRFKEQLILQGNIDPANKPILQELLEHLGLINSQVPVVYDSLVINSKDPILWTLLSTRSINVTANVLTLGKYGGTASAINAPAISFNTRSLPVIGINTFNWAAVRTIIVNSSGDEIVDMTNNRLLRYVFSNQVKNVETFILDPRIYGPKSLELASIFNNMTKLKVIDVGYHTLGRRLHLPNLNAIRCGGGDVYNAQSIHIYKCPSGSPVVFTSPIRNVVEVGLSSWSELRYFPDCSRLISLVVKYDRMEKESVVGAVVEQLDPARLENISINIRAAFETQLNTRLAEKVLTHVNTSALISLNLHIRIRSVPAILKDSVCRQLQHFAINLWGNTNPTIMNDLYVALLNCPKLKSLKLYNFLDPIFVNLLIRNSTLKDTLQTLTVAFADQSGGPQFDRNILTLIATILNYSKIFRIVSNDNTLSSSSISNSISAAVQQKGLFNPITQEDALAFSRLRLRLNVPSPTS